MYDYLLNCIRCHSSYTIDACTLIITMPRVRTPTMVVLCGIVMNSISRDSIILY